MGQTCPTCGNGWIKTDNVPTWIFNSNYWYWTSSQYNDSSSHVWYVSNNGDLSSHYVISNYVYGSGGVVRPVIVLKKTILGDADESIATDNDNTDSKKENIIDKEENSLVVKVDNTYMNSSIMLIISGFIFACISVLIIYKKSNKTMK